MIRDINRLIQQKRNPSSHTAGKNTFQQQLTMSDKIISSFQTLSVELVYRIMDHMHDLTIVCSMINVCSRMNTIVDTYHRCLVNFFLLDCLEINSLFIFIISYRHSLDSTSSTSKSETEVHSILVKDYKTTQ